MIWGASGVGKSEVASLLGKICSLKVVDLDQVISERAGRSIKEIFRVEGESYFRDLEHQELSRLLGGGSRNAEITGLDFDILSLGGGCITFERNREVLRRAKVKTVWLKALAETISDRIEAAIQLAGCNERPLVATVGKSNQSAQQAILVSVREKLQERDADYCIADIWLWTDWADAEGIARWLEGRFAGRTSELGCSGRQLVFVVGKGSIVICEGDTTKDEFLPGNTGKSVSWLEAVRRGNILYRGEYRNFKSMEQVIAGALGSLSGGEL